ncbi:outer membrane lipoprotein carrier protein LolA [Oceanobacillus piezotolerans]|uniref:Outer membrane lipoprotein carrier protein LolA n=1 Tax=Oceanobacillus piezotolerans TaxID=2448030 RepID=A0A498DAX8_9BACI|nr:outer membrane lipoprotein carrier protein LolA [Oceanobacillus piezotolerans]RLL42138.1 outer membrane lipoprotein carrier protein LolA [Oceanobacillus piezotolerans]
MTKILSRGKLILFVFIVLLLAACGEKSQEDVAGTLQKKVDEMTGYKAKAEMSMNTGQEEQKFNIDIWHQEGDLYRVALSGNTDEQGSQIILKNEDGVFVLTPALEKSFRFQSEWPNNGSQPYLYQSLVEDVLNDSEATFESTETDYIFRTKTNYQSNNNLPFQEIYFSKKTYTPTLVKVMDKDNNALVEVKFSSFELDPTFAEDDFSMEKNMASNDASATVAGEASPGVLEIVMPEFTAGGELTEQKEIELENGKRVILTFDGEKNFTLVQERKESSPAMTHPQEVEGDIVNLGHAVAALSDNRLEWTYNGVDYTLASDELTKEEMIQVAQTVQGKAVK